MRPFAISAVLLGVAHVTLGAAAALPASAAAPLRAAPGEGADGGVGVTLARAGASSFLAVPGTRDAAVVQAGDGGEGGEGGRGRWRRGHGYGYAPGAYFAPYGWGPPPRYYRPPPVYYAPPPRYYGPPPIYYAPPPPVYYPRAPGIRLYFGF